MKGIQMEESTLEENILITKTKYVTFSEGLKLTNGKFLSPYTIAYETYGKLNDEKSNAILICHALSGDAHAAGVNQDNGKIGWWDSLIGPSKTIDTNKYFVIASNVIGGCSGSTGPSSINPETGERYAMNFPEITIEDMVNAQSKLLDYLGIDRLFSVIGGSMGGMQVVQWLKSYPEKVVSAVPIATTLRHNAQQIAFNEVGRMSIISDPKWNNGNYYDREFPISGLSVARMIGHITYLSGELMDMKFGRKLAKNYSDSIIGTRFEVESYLRYKGESFTKRFDPNSYLYITRAMDMFNISKEDLEDLSSVKVLGISFNSDWLYPTYQTQELVEAFSEAGATVYAKEIQSPKGHDSFLTDVEAMSPVITEFLSSIETDK